MILQAENLTKVYGDLPVLQGASLSVEAGEVVSVVGASGAGKSTLLHILGTLDQADTGTLHINQQEITKMSAKQLAQFRNRNLGFVFQFHNLLPEFTALENACMPALISGKSPQEAEEIVMPLFQRLRIENRTKHKPSELSGGEQQRVAVARALINRPAIVFADEPSGNLDSDNARGLHELFFNLREELDQTFIIVTHNPDFAKMADRQLEIKEGKVLI